MEEYPPVPEKKGLHALAFLKVGIIEFFLVAIVLILLFGTLNYFNILSISGVFPKQLSWLPHQIIKQNPVPSPVNYTSHVFQYDTAKAEKLLTQYIKDTIKPEFLPAKIEIKQGLSQDGKIENSQHQFGSFSRTKEYILSTNFSYEEDKNLPNGYGIIFQLSNVAEATSTASLTNQLLSTYFKNPNFISNCQTKGITSYCESFQTLNDGKRGYGITFTSQEEEPTHIIFTCFVPKESKDYATRTSCISQ